MLVSHERLSHMKGFSRIHFYRTAVYRHDEEDVIVATSHNDEDEDVSLSHITYHEKDSTESTLQSWSRRLPQ